MTFKLTATLTHKGWGDPVIKTVYYQGDTFHDILERLKADNIPKNHLHNLLNYKKTAFKDANGVKHSWRLEHMEGIN